MLLCVCCSISFSIYIFISSIVSSLVESVAVAYCVFYSVKQMQQFVGLTVNNMTYLVFGPVTGVLLNVINHVATDIVVLRRSVIVINTLYMICLPWLL